MIAAAILVATAGGLLETSTWNAAGRSGKRAEPDYKTIVSKLIDSVPSGQWAAALPTAVVKKAGNELRQLRGAMKTAPDYMQVASAVLANVHGAANAELSGLAEGSIRKAEGSIRQLRAAYRSAPDYAKIASGVLASFSAPTAEEDAAEVADDESITFDCFGFALQAPDPIRTIVRNAPDSLRTVARRAAKVTFWQDVAADATPDYGAIAAAVALEGRDDADDDSMSGWN